MKLRAAGIGIAIATFVAMTGHAQQDAQQGAQQGSQPGSRSRPSAERFERQIQPGGRGPNRLAIDQWAVTVGQPFNVMSVGATDRDLPRALVAVGGLGDLRLFDASDRELSYLLVPPVQPVPRWQAGELLPLIETKTSSGFEVAFGTALSIDRVRIDGLPPRFLKRAALEGSGDRAHWTALAPEATLFDLPDDNLKQLAILFPAGEYRYLRLTWDDRSSGRLPMPTTVLVREAARVPAPEPLRVPLEVEKRPSEPGRSRYRVIFPAGHMPVTDLEVVANDRNILRRARVTEPQLIGEQLVPLQLGTTTLRRASREEDDATAADLRVPITAPTSTRVELTIEDGNNAPLDLTGVTAVLAPLPWIYFESPDGAPLVARLGDRRAHAPAYDLEAVRPNLSRISMATASWGAVPTAPLSTASTSAGVEGGVAGGAGAAGVGATGGGAAAGAGSGNGAGAIGGAVGGGAVGGAALDVSEFRFSREVPASPAGLTALALDAAVLAHSHLGDVRLVDRDGRQQAYVLESRDEPLTLALGSAAGAAGGARAAGGGAGTSTGTGVGKGSGSGPLAPGQAPEWLSEQLKNAPSGNRTVYRIALPYDTLPASKLVLTTGTRVFSRQVAVFERWDPQAGRDGVGARRLASATWAHADPEEPAPLLTFELPALQTADLVLLVDEGDNAPLPIESVRMLLPGYQIRFLRVDAQHAQPLTLYYGDATLSAPRYDLALLKPYLLDAPAGEIAPGPEREHASTGASAAHLPAWGFWGVLVAAVLVLVGLIVRLLRGEEEAGAGVR